MNICCFMGWDCGTSEMAVASHPLLSGLLDGNLQQGELGFNALSSLQCSPEASELTGNADDCGTSLVAISSKKLLLDDSLQHVNLGFDSLSALHCSPKASELKGTTDVLEDPLKIEEPNVHVKRDPELKHDTEGSEHKVTRSDVIKSPEFYDCGSAPVSDLTPEEPECASLLKEEVLNSDVQPSEQSPAQVARTPQSQMNHSEVIELPDENIKQNGNNALPVRGFQTAGAAVGAERQNDDVVLCDSQGVDSLREEFCRADIPGVPRMGDRDREEVGDIVILEPTINKEVPASVSRESSSPRLFEENTSKPDEPLEDTGAHSGWETGSSVGKPSRQSAACKWWQSDGTRHTGVATGSWRKLATGKPLYQFTCSSCLKLFSSRYELIRHVFVHVNGVEPPGHVCVLCGEVFTSDKELANHHKSTGAQCYAFVPVLEMRVGTGEGVWVCSTCEQTFQTEHQLAVHKAEQHLRTVVLACTEPSVPVTKLCDLTQVRVDNRLENSHSRKRGQKRETLPRLLQQETFNKSDKKKMGRPRIHLHETSHSNHKRKPGRSPRIFPDELMTPEVPSGEPVEGESGINSGEMPRRKPGRCRVTKPKIIRAQICDSLPQVVLENCIDRISEKKPGEPLNRKPEMPSELAASRLLDITQGDPEMPSGEILNRKTKMQSGEPDDRINEVKLIESLDRIPKSGHGETHDRRTETARGEISDKRGETAHRETLDRIPEAVHEDILNRMPETVSGEDLDRKPEMTPRESLEMTKLSTVAPGIPLNKFTTTTPEPFKNKYKITPGEPFNSKPGMTPDHLIDCKPKKRRGRPPGSKNKGPSKPRAKKPKTTSGELLNGTPEMAAGKPLQRLEDIRSGECMDRLLEMTSGMPLEILDEMSSGPPPDRLYKMRSGECFYDLIPGEVSDRQHRMISGEHLYGLHEMAQQEQLYRLQEMTPGMPLDSNPDGTPRESLDRRHDTTQGEPLYRLHEMTTVESVHRLTEMSPVEILYRKHESTPGSPFDRLPKICTAEPLSRLHEMTPIDIHYGNNENKNQENTPGLPLDIISDISGEPFNSLPETLSGETLHRPSEMALREPLHRLSEMAPREPLHRLSEMAQVETLHRPSEMASGETLCRLSEMALGQTVHRPSEVAPGEPVRRLSEMAPREPLHTLSEVPPGDLLHRLSEMEPRDPLHTLFEMATGDPFHTLLEMSPGEPYERLSEITPGEHLDNKSEVASGNFINGTPKRKRGRPPGSKNKNPGKPRCRKPKTLSGELLCTVPKKPGEPGDKISELPPGALIPEITLGDSGDKKTNKNLGETDKWTCHFCRQLFCSISGLKRHLVRHTGERNYVCDLCGKSFGRSDNLRVHKYTHMGGLPYKCDVCGKGFGWACHLRDHRRKHTKETS